jgi:hypothetical protein
VLFFVKTRVEKFREHLLAQNLSLQNVIDGIAMRVSSLAPANGKNPQIRIVGNLSKQNTGMLLVALKISAKTGPTGKITAKAKGT